MKKVSKVELTKMCIEAMEKENKEEGFNKYVRFHFDSILSWLDINLKKDVFMEDVPTIIANCKCIHENLDAEIEELWKDFCPN